MKKSTFLFSFFFAAFLILNMNTYSQTWEGSVTNLIIESDNSATFDVYFKNTSGSDWIYSHGNVAFTYNNLVLNGGILTFSLVAGFSDFPASAQPPSALTSGTNILRTSSNLPGSNGTILAGQTLRFYRFRVQTSASSFHSTEPFNLLWKKETVPYTRIYYWNGSIGVEITGSNLSWVELPNSPLPIELTSFAAIGQRRDINLSWQTKTEVNSSIFQVERTAQSSHSWVKVGEVAASGNSNSPKEYSFTDRKLNSGKYSYRLKMIDNDGKFKYSDAIESEVALPKDYAVSQNYPNPFNPTTRIDYQLPFDSKVTIELYGITGERVATLINGELSAGYYTTDVNTSALNLASGVYIYRMTAQNSAEKNFVQVKKLMLTK